MDTQSEKNNVQNEMEVTASGAKTRRKRNSVIVTFLFPITVAVVALAYFLLWQHGEETEDTYVAGRLIMITSQANGTVRKVIYDDTDAVKKGDVLATLDDGDFWLAYDRA